MKYKKTLSVILKKKLTLFKIQILIFKKKIKKLFYITILLNCFIYKINGQTCNFVSSYFGGTQQDEIKSVCVDANKNSYILGNTYSTDLPITIGKINDTHSGDYDAFLCKFDSCGILKWCTYFGTSSYDSGEKMTISNDGNIVFCGYTSGVTSHTTAGCFQTVNGGGYDCFITKINPNGNIIWSTYYGKNGGDFAFEIKVDNFNNVIIGGTTTSNNLYTTSSSFQQLKQANTDAFIARFDKNGQLKWCTYYGGNSSEDIHALSIDQNYNIIGIGGSYSTNLNTSLGAHQTINDGLLDGYIIKLDSNCTRVFSSYLGGSGIDDLWGNAIDVIGNIYISGHTTSTDFDLTLGAYQTTNNGNYDLFVSKFSPLGNLIISTLLGGSQNEVNTRMILSSPTEITLLGKSDSNDFPMIGSPIQPTKGVSYDAIISKLTTINLIPNWTSFYGGNGDEDTWDCVSINNSNFIFVGGSNSTNYPTSLAAYQSTLNMSIDGMFTKLNIGNLIPTSNNNLINSENDILIFPNPTKDKIKINSELDFAFSCYNLLGENVTNKVTYDDGNYINTSLLNNGVYFLIITTKYDTFTYKIIKEE